MDPDYSDPAQLSLAQRAAKALRCPVCETDGSLEFSSVVVGQEHLGRLACTTPGCPVDETTRGDL